MGHAVATGEDDEKPLGVAKVEISSELPRMRVSMTLTLSLEESNALDELAAKKDLSKTGLIRQALRLYQLVDARTSAGERVTMYNDRLQKSSDLLIL